MATRRKPRRRRRPVEEEVPEEELLDEEEYEDDDPEDDESEEEATAPRRRRRKPAPEPEEEEPDEDDDKDEPEEEPAPKRRRRKPAAKKEPEPEEEEEDEPDEVTGNVELLADLLDALEEGDALLLTRTGKAKWTIATGASVPVAKQPAMSRNAFVWHTFITQEYKDWMEEWNEKDQKAKIAYAKKNKITWEEHDSDRVTAMRVTEAVRDAEGIEKYHEEYATRAQRNKALREAGYN